MKGLDHVSTTVETRATSQQHTSVNEIAAKELCRHERTATLQHTLHRCATILLLIFVYNQATSCDLRTASIEMTGKGKDHQSVIW